MTKQWSEIKAAHPVSDEARSHAHLQNLADDFGVALSQLRRGEALTQIEVAHRLLVTQPTISEIERTDSPSVPTVRRYVEALGARLELVAVFDDGRRIALDPVRPRSASPTRVRERQERHQAAKSSKTGKPAASAAAKTLRSNAATKTAKSAAGSALSQRGSRNVTGKSAASAAGKTLKSKTATKTAKSAAGSALSQKPSKRR